ncbi:hypothetical protein ACIGO6_17860 [Streptomyces sp. NPDC053750]|uniref:hypothetical protein n=1 Tax=Streptomyces sp. NPDC053750 TaxID=3365714 RepID=UPI0037CD79D8
MHGHGHAPPPPPRRPRTAVLVLLRVFFVALPLLSLGFLAWISTLYAAIVTRRPRDWWAFAASAAVLVVSFCLLATDHTDDFSTPAGTVGMIILLLNACACAGYFLYADIRHHQQRLHPGHPGHPGPVPAPFATTAYGHPQPPYPYAAAPAPAPAPAPAQPPAPPYQAAPPHTPVPQAPPPPHPARIDQVRAELDELSDYLRHHDGNGNGNHQGGR